MELILLIGIFLLTLLYFFGYFSSPASASLSPGEPEQEEPQLKEKKLPEEYRPVEISDATLPTVTLSTVGLLLKRKESSPSDDDGEGFELDNEMVEFVRAIKDKYRVYLLTRLTPEENKLGCNKKEMEDADDLLRKLVKQEIIKGAHRLLYSTTEPGHVAQVRHLGASLHIEGDVKVVKGLAQFMRKFHLVGSSLNSADVEFVKNHSGKVMYFSDVGSYALKIKNALAK